MKRIETPGSAALATARAPASVAPPEMPQKMPSLPGERARQAQRLAARDADHAVDMAGGEGVVGELGDEVGRPAWTTWGRKRGWLEAGAPSGR